MSDNGLIPFFNIVLTTFVAQKLKTSQLNLCQKKNN